MINKIIVRKSKANPENIVFLGFEADSEGLTAQQVTAWAKPINGDVEKTLEAIKTKKLKGTISSNNGNATFKFDPNGKEIVVQ